MLARRESETTAATRVSSQTRTANEKTVAAIRAPMITPITISRAASDRNAERHAADHDGLGLRAPAFSRPRPVNEYRSGRAVEALHAQIRRNALAERDGRVQGSYE